MEVGAVKQAYNNELILLKKKLNQAKIQVIHKLTRKAKTLAEKKAPEPLKDKLKRKAESAVKEVLIIKKVKARDIGRFIVTQKGQLQEYLNKPQVDLNKACARLLLHKALQDKYKFIKNRFADVPIKDLLMSRQERLKMKKEAREKQKNKREKKKNSKVVNAEGDWDVEDVKLGSKKLSGKKQNGSDDQKDMDDENSTDNEQDTDNEQGADDEEVTDDEISADAASEGSHSGGEEQNSDLEESNEDIKMESDVQSETNENNDNDVDSDSGKFIKLSPIKKDTKPTIQTATIKNLNIKNKLQLQNKKKPDKKQKDNNKKNLNDKILNRKFKKESDEGLISKNKVVDPFFITSTGENYMSLAEPRQPDEVKEVHKQGNRQLRRAIMFGHVPKNRPRQVRQENNYNRQNGFDQRSNDKFDRQNSNQFNNKGDSRSNFKDKSFRNERKSEETKPEKLHPSWEAKKKLSGILPFQGKKIVFDES